MREINLGIYKHAFNQESRKEKGTPMARMHVTEEVIKQASKLHECSQIWMQQWMQQSIQVWSKKASKHVAIYVAATDAIKEANKHQN